MLRFLTKRVRHSLCFATNAMCACENCRIGLFFKVYSIHSEKKQPSTFLTSIRLRESGGQVFDSFRKNQKPVPLILGKNK